MTSYRERLSAPPTWWAGCVVNAVIFGWIVLVATTRAAAGVTFVVVLIASVAAVARYGSVLVERDESGLRVGRAFLEAAHVGPAEALHRDDYRRRLGVEADARAYLVTRPYLDRGVLVHVADPKDPAPYWLISSRHPDEFTAAINSAADSRTARSEEISHRGQEA